MPITYFNDQGDIWQALRAAVSRLRVFNDIIAIPSRNATVAVILPWRAVELFAKPSGDAEKAEDFIQGAKVILAGSNWQSAQLSGQLREADMAALGYGWHEAVGRVSKGNAITFSYCQAPVGLIVPAIALFSVAKFPACSTADDRMLRDIAVRATGPGDYPVHAGLSPRPRGIGELQLSSPL